MGIHASGDGRSVGDAAWTLAVPRSQSPRTRFDDPRWKRASDKRDGEDCGRRRLASGKCQPKMQGEMQGKRWWRATASTRSHARHTSRDDSGLFCWLTWLVRVPGDTPSCATIWCGWERHSITRVSRLQTKAKPRLCQRQLPPTGQSRSCLLSSDDSLTRAISRSKSLPSAR